MALFFSTTSRGSMKIVDPLADISCTMPLTRPLYWDFRGRTTRPSRCVGVVVCQYVRGGAVLQQAAHRAVGILAVAPDALPDGMQLGDLLLPQQPFLVDDAEDPARQRRQVGDPAGDLRQAALSRRPTDDPLELQGGEHPASDAGQLLSLELAALLAQAWRAPRRDRENRIRD